MTKIALLLPDLRCGGAEQVCIQLAREFVNKGYSVEFLLLSSSGELLETASSITSVHSLEVSRFREVLLPLSRYISLHQPDVLLASMWPLTCLAPLSKGISRSRTKVIISEHCTLENQHKDWGALTYAGLCLSTTIGYRLADQCIAVSQGVAQSMSQLAHFPVDRITVKLTNLGQILSLGCSEKEFTTGCCMAIRRHLKYLALPIPKFHPHDAWLNRLSNILEVKKVIPSVLQLYRRHGENTSNGIASRIKKGKG